jgi:hypothetical protein
LNLFRDAPSSPNFGRGGEHSVLTSISICGANSKLWTSAAQVQIVHELARTLFCSVTLDSCTQSNLFYLYTVKAKRYTYVYLALGILGIVGGLIYWQFWGCTDSCPIDSSWKWSAVRGGLIGLCIAAVFQPSGKKSSDPDPKPEM